MRILPNDKQGFLRLLDDAYSPESSIVLRYRNLIGFEENLTREARYKEWLTQVSIREGARIFPLLKYEGVEICIFDTASLMHTNTLKAIDGCISISKCKLKNYNRVAFESGGNTGSALTEYATRAGVETFLFMPEDNISLLCGSAFDNPKAHLIAVKDPGLVKEVCGEFVRLTKCTHIPQVEWRYEASMFRGLFLAEHMMKDGRFDWITQTISAAFGPIGIYRSLQRFYRKLPRFLGIQQEANCPMYKAWKRKGKMDNECALSSTKQLLTKVMYDANPHTYGTYKDLEDVLRSVRGDLTTINYAEFMDFLKNDFSGKDILGLLKEKGITITQDRGQVVEKTGLMALAGTLKEIDKGIIARKSKVLCCLTSGPTQADGKAKPEFTVSKLSGIKEKYIPWLKRR